MISVLHAFSEESTAIFSAFDIPGTSELLTCSRPIQKSCSLVGEMTKVGPQILGGDREHCFSNF